MLPERFASRSRARPVGSARTSTWSAGSWRCEAKADCSSGKAAGW